MGVTGEKSSLFCQSLVLSRGWVCKEKAAAGTGLDPTFRKVKAVHFSSSVPSGDSIRPTKQAFQISSTKSGEGMRCGAQRQNPLSAGKAVKCLPPSTAKP